MPIKPEDVNPSTLPTSLRGYQREATDDLLMRVASDYRQAIRAQEGWVKDEKHLTGRIGELEAELAAEKASFERALLERTKTLADEIEQLIATVREHESREELTRTLVATAQRAARELREAARAECEALVRAAQRRAVEIEEEARASVRSSAREVERLRKVDLDLRAELRRTLESVLARPQPAPERAPDRPAPVA